MHLNHGTLPMEAYHKATRVMWDPGDIDFAADGTDWPLRSADERDSTLTLISLFHAGEEAVTYDLAPLLTRLRNDGGHLEDEMFLTAQLFEESRHFEFFDRWLDEVPDASSTWPSTWVRFIAGSSFTNCRPRSTGGTRMSHLWHKPKPSSRTS
jgi:ribonucleotide reductase beta subunit family protein with ferritin-like domain